MDTTAILLTYLLWFAFAFPFAAFMMSKGIKKQ